MDGATTPPLLLIAGRGSYPRALAQSARRQGVGVLHAIAFRGETDAALEALVDRMVWLHVGELGKFLDAARASGANTAVMAGQIAPSNLFRVRMDGPMIRLLGRLKRRNADTIFGAIADELKGIGIELQPASRYMESTMPAPGRIGSRDLTDRERADVEIGLHTAKVTSGLEIGQTVVIKEGTILAVEAFEGTDAAILRGGELGGPGAVVVKVAKRGHDMRFDIPVVGEHTFASLRRIKASALAVEAGRTILLDREALAKAADAMNLAFVAVETGHQG
jgi:hypothetical protein